MASRTTHQRCVSRRRIVAVSVAYSQKEALVSIDENQFDLLADRWMSRLEKSLGELDPDECEVSLSMGVMTLEFRDRSRFIVNSHRAARQIWLAANLHAWHFNHDPVTDRWLDDRAGEDLVQVLERLVSDKVGTPIRL